MHTHLCCFTPVTLSAGVLGSRGWCVQWGVEGCITQLLSCTHRGEPMGSTLFTSLYLQCLACVSWVPKMPAASANSVWLKSGTRAYSCLKVSLGTQRRCWAFVQKVKVNSALCWIQIIQTSGRANSGFAITLACILLTININAYCLCPLCPVMCVSLLYRVLYKHDLQDQSLRAGLQKAQCQSALQPLY